MDRIRYFADLSIRRACGFGFLAIGTGVTALYWNIVAAINLAATGVSFMGALLLWKAFEARSRSYRRTEVFLLMDRQHEFPEERAQQVFANVLRERYMWHATVAAITAVVLWLLYFLLHAVEQAPPP
ncbi:MAG: hypothetical protein HY246_12185 [Proteobacteria bacterium]|nr:hypothetical protein [Pseudomonadota bacterium]